MKFVSNQKEIGLKYFCLKSNRIQYSKILGFGYWDMVVGDVIQKIKVYWERIFGFFVCKKLFF